MSKGTKKKKDKKNKERTKEKLENRDDSDIERKDESEEPADNVTSMSWSSEVEESQAETAKILHFTCPAHTTLTMQASDFSPRLTVVCGED